MAGEAFAEAQAHVCDRDDVVADRRVCRVVVGRAMVCCMIASSVVTVVLIEAFTQDQVDVRGEGAALVSAGFVHDARGAGDPFDRFDVRGVDWCASYFE